MALIKLLKTFKLRYVIASSIVESIIAVVLISTCAMVGFVIYLNVILQSKTTYYYEAKHKIETIHYKACKEQDLNNETFSYTYYTINKEVNVNNTIAFVDYIITIGSKKSTITKLILTNDKN